jgi:hypothetical protein
MACGGKEEIHVLTRLAQQQVQIYDDAADVGVIETPEVRRQIKEAVKSLANLEGYLYTNHGNAGPSSWTTVRVRVGWEYDGPNVNGTEVEIVKVIDLRRKKTFYTIDINAKSWPREGAKLLGPIPL